LLIDSAAVLPFRVVVADSLGLSLSVRRCHRGRGARQDPVHLFWSSRGGDGCSSFARRSSCRHLYFLWNLRCVAVISVGGSGDEVRLTAATSRTDRSMGWDRGEDGRWHRRSHGGGRRAQLIMATIRFTSLDLGQKSAFFRRL
jgi:hypothetical protein